MKDSSQDTGTSCVEVTQEDLLEALKDVGTYVDISVGDLKLLCESAEKHARTRIAAQVPVGEVMTKKVVSVREDADLHEAAKLLSDNRISGMPVVDERMVVKGVISEADVLAMSGVKRGHTVKEVIGHLFGEPLPGRKGEKVADFMSAPAVTIEARADLREAATILDKKRIKRLPVVDGEGRLVGIVSRGDIVKAMAER